VTAPYNKLTTSMKKNKSRVNDTISMPSNTKISSLTFDVLLSRNLMMLVLECQCSSNKEKEEADP